MNFKSALIVMTLFLGFSQIAFSQNSEDPVEQNEVPQAAQIFPNDVERTLEDSRRNEREMRAYKERLQKPKVQPE